MKNFVKNRHAMLVVVGLAVTVTGTLAAPVPLGEELDLPGVLSDGNLGQLGSSESGRGTFKGTINTKTGAARGAIRGEVGNLSSKPQRFNNNASVETIISSQLHELLFDIRNSKYSVSKPQRDTQRGKVRGSVRGWATSTKARVKYAQQQDEEP